MQAARPNPLINRHNELTQNGKPELVRGSLRSDGPGKALRVKTGPKLLRNRVSSAKHTEWAYRNALAHVLDAAHSMFGSQYLAQPRVMKVIQTTFPAPLDPSSQAIGADVFARVGEAFDKIRAQEDLAASFARLGETCEPRSSLKGTSAPPESKSARLAEPVYFHPLPQSDPKQRENGKKFLVTPSATRHDTASIYPAVKRGQELPEPSAPPIDDLEVLPLLTKTQVSRAKFWNAQLRLALDSDASAVRSESSRAYISRATRMLVYFAVRAFDGSAHDAADFLPAPLIAAARRLHADPSEHPGVALYYSVDSADQARVRAALPASLQGLCLV